jgi:hypothetical protein
MQHRLSRPLLKPKATVHDRLGLIWQKLKH